MNLHENTPSGTGRTALDKFVMHYTAQGYAYETVNNDFIFRKPGSILFAEAVISPETGHITGYNVVDITSTTNHINSRPAPAKGREKGDKC